MRTPVLTSHLSYTSSVVLVMLLPISRWTILPTPSIMHQALNEVLGWGVYWLMYFYRVRAIQYVYQYLYIHIHHCTSASEIRRFMWQLQLGTLILKFTLGLGLDWDYIGRICMYLVHVHTDTTGFASKRFDPPAGLVGWSDYWQSTERRDTNSTFAGVRERTSEC